MPTPSALKRLAQALMLRQLLGEGRERAAFGSQQLQKLVELRPGAEVAGKGGQAG